MGCNCGDNEYNITVDNNGNYEPTTPVYNITLANVGVNGYSPIVKFVNETVEGFNIAVDNVTGTETSPAVPKLSYISDQFNNINTTIANLGDTYLTVNGSNAANPITLNHLTMGYQYGSPYINSDGNLYIRGAVLSLQATGDISLSTTGTNKAYYNNNEIATVNNLDTYLKTDGSNIDRDFSITNHSFTINNTTIDDLGRIIGNTSGALYLRDAGGNTSLSINSQGVSMLNNVGQSFTINNKQIATVDQIPTVGNGTITITQGGVAKGTFTTNQSGNTTIELDEGGGVTNPLTITDEVSNNFLQFVVNDSGSYIRTGTQGLTLNGYLINTVDNPLSLNDVAFGLKAIGLKYDNDTIKVNQDGQLYADVQGGGGSYTAGTGIDITNDTISVDNTVAMKTDIPTNNNQLTNGAGYITGINSSDVINALEFTPADDSDVVKTTGNQDIADNKTFTGRAISRNAWQVERDDFTKGDIPTSTKYFGLFGLNVLPQDSSSTDWQDKRLGIVEATVDTSGNTTLLFGVYRNKTNADGGGNAFQFMLKKNANNSGYAALSVSPATSDNSTKVATTAFVKNNLSSYVPSSRTINGKALSSNISLTASDIGALPNTTNIEALTTTAQLDALNSGITSGDVTLIRTALQPNDNISELINDAGYITPASLTTVLNDYQPLLENGTNIKTINNQSILGSGNITIQGGGTVDQTFDGTSQNAQSGVAIQGELSTNYQSKLVSGTNIKTINNQSILGSGDIAALVNTATKSTSLTIGDNASTLNYTTNVGIGSQATATAGQAFGHYAIAGGQYSLALGQGSETSSNYAIQLGKGTNATATTLSVGFGNSGNYQLLNGTTGLIPDARISSNIARTSAIPDISNLANTSLSNLSTTGQAVIDGQWVNGNNQQIVYNVTLENGTHTYDLSDYLPNDNYSYEVILSVRGRTPTASGSYSNIYVGSDLISGILVSYESHRNTNYVQWGGTAYIPLNNRTVTITTTCGSGNSVTGVVIEFLGYRRLGTNV